MLINYRTKGMAAVILMAIFVWGCAPRLVVPAEVRQMQERAKIFFYQGLAITYYEQGQGQPMVLLHGFGAFSYTWRNVEKYFSKSNRVISIDLKGFGLSAKPDDNAYSAKDQSRLIAQFIKEQGIAEAILVGNSFGGAVALLTYLELAKEAQNPISKLILIDSAGYPQEMPDFIAILRIPLLNRLFLSLVPSRVQARMVLKKAFFDHGKITPEMVEAYGSNLAQPGAHQALIKTAGQIVPPDLERLLEQYPSINIPALIIWGEADKIVPLAVGRKLAEAIPQAQLVKLPNCGHIPQEECPAETLEVMADFLKTRGNGEDRDRKGF